LPTIRELEGIGADQIIITAHRGRPDGHDPELSTDIIADHLSDLLGEDMYHADYPIPKPSDLPGPEEHNIILLENIRYIDGETDNSDSVAQRLANLADAYVNDAFGAAHRQHSSTHAVQRYLPSYKGRQMEAEESIGKKIRDHDNTAFILGGAKLSTKLDLIEALHENASTIHLGGTMFLPFLAAQNQRTGKTSVDNNHVETAQTMLSYPNVALPDSVKTTDDLDDPSAVETHPSNSIPPEQCVGDISADEADAILTSVQRSDLIVWNGPLGYYETEAFREATKTVMHGLTDVDADVIIGGGDTGAIISEAGLQDEFYHVSSGGGAFLTLLKQGSLPVFDD
jgi:phosphoglycerate kinase